MKTIKANNFESAIAELKAFSKGAEKSIKEAIPANNKDHFNVIMVKIIDQPGKPQNVVQSTVVCYDKQRFERVKKNFAFHGYSKMIVLHDPTKMKDQKKVDEIPSHIKAKSMAELKAEMEAEIEKKAQAKFEAKMKEFNEAKAKAEAESKDGEEVKTTEPDSEGGEKIDGSGLDELTVVQLKEYASDNQIDLKGLKTKDEIKGAVQAWIDDQNGQA